MEQQDYVSPSVDLEPDEEKTAFDRFAEVFTAPSEAFSRLAESTRKGKIILWGMVIALIVTAFSVILVSANGEVREKALQEQLEAFEEARDAGKVDDKTYEQQVEMTTMMMSGPLFIGVGVLFGTLASILLSLLIGLVVFILVRVLSRGSDNNVGYAAALCATLIAFMISNVESIITSVGIFLTTDLGFRLSPAALVATENDFVEFALNLVNPFTIWLWFALGTGVAMLARTERMKGITAVAAVWIVGGLAITGIGMMWKSAFGG